MSAQRMLGAMVAGSVIVVLAASLRSEPTPSAPVKQPSQESPWLTREAAAQIIGTDGRPGPLFADAQLGGPAPSPAVRERIAAFARANHVGIDLEIVDDELAAINFDVLYGGCCGYEGADVLAMRLRRPSTSSCCGCRSTWLNEWALASDGVYTHARVRVNQVEVRWEREATLPDILDRSEALLGADASTIREGAHNWSQIEPHLYVLALPYLFPELYGFDQAVAVQEYGDFGIRVAVERGTIVDVSMALPRLDEERGRDVGAILRARWGRPQIARDDSWTWRRSDRIITAYLYAWPMRLAISRR